MITILPTFRRTAALFLFPLSMLLTQANAQSCLTNQGTASSKTTVWLKPDNATQSGGVVSAWPNAGYATALSSFAVTGTGSSIIYLPTGLNFNPTVKFNAGQYMRVPSVPRSSFMPDNTAFTAISVNYAASGIMFGHQSGTSTQKLSHEIGGGFIGGSPAWFTFPTTGSASLTTIQVNAGTVYPYGDGRVGSTIAYSSLAEGTADLVVGAFRAGEYKMNGHVAEILMYNFSLSALQRNQVESYLAAKYGITLDQTAAQNYTASDGTVFWSAAANGARKVRITAIGRDDCFGLNQKQSISSETGAMVTVGNGTSLATTNLLNTNAFALDKMFFSFGDDNGSITSFTSTGAPTGRLILNRKWQVDEPNAVDSVRISVPDDGSTASVKLPTETNRILLMVDADGDFSSGAVQKSMTLNGTNWETNYNFADGNYFTFATLAPGYTLPVKFTRFDAQIMPNSSINLVWNVETEQSTRGYQVEKSIDGVNFTSIGFVNASGLKAYSFTDVTPVISAYYRIRYIDKDNSTGLTATTRIKGRKVAILTKAFLSNSNTITVLHETALQGTVISINSLDGKLLTSTAPQPGTQRTTILLPAGNMKIYLVRYQRPNSETETMKVSR